MRVDHVGIMVRDIERSLDWYQRVLGLRLAERRRLGETDLAFLEAGNTRIELIQSGGGYPSEGVVNHVAFAVDDLDAVMTRLKAAGVAFDDEYPQAIWEGGRIGFFEGPDGEVLELIESR